jgi:hypothetical protein
MSVIDWCDDRKKEKGIKEDGVSLATDPVLTVRGLDYLAATADETDQTEQAEAREDHARRLWNNGQLDRLTTIEF